MGDASRVPRPIRLDERLAGHIPPPRTRRLSRSAFAGSRSGGLRERLERRLDDAVRVFELDRLLYDVEVEAQERWLERLVEFDAYWARRLRGEG
jgi:hypothetical protein